jgi:hypothetical protein
MNGELGEEERNSHLTPTNEKSEHHDGAQFNFKEHF